MLQRPGPQRRRALVRHLFFQVRERKRLLVFRKLQVLGVWLRGKRQHRLRRLPQNRQVRLRSRWINHLRCLHWNPSFVIRNLHRMSSWILPGLRGLRRRNNQYAKTASDPEKRPRPRAAPPVPGLKYYNLGLARNVRLDPSRARTNFLVQLNLPVPPNTAPDLKKSLLELAGARPPASRETITLFVSTASESERWYLERPDLQLASLALELKFCKPVFVQNVPTISSQAKTSFLYKLFLKIQPRKHLLNHKYLYLRLDQRLRWHFQLNLFLLLGSRKNYFRNYLCFLLQNPSSPIRNLLRMPLKSRPISRQINLHHLLLDIRRRFNILLIRYLQVLKPQRVPRKLTKNHALTAGERGKDKRNLLFKRFRLQLVAQGEVQNPISKVCTCNWNQGVHRQLDLATAIISSGTLKEDAM
ncbi:Hypothetical_protein [Hexamita inflata]|uniref:Hypothetical_protein n=1 Tax=Hexamita inflata TaxID=28002 RepID=A0AA86UBE9_9EUKA|nr:Hypothetical protein HINF_LOCUS23283 [Hexamita inflata]